GVVLHLLRGSGLAGMRGMPARRGHYVRPWLGVWRSEVNELLAARGIEAYEDPANFDTRFARVRVRREILPALEHDRPGITKLFHSAAMAAVRLQEAAENEPSPVEVLKRMYSDGGGSQPGLSRRHIQSMLSLATSQGRGGRGIDLPGGLRFRIVGGRMEIVPAQRPAAPSPRLEVRSCAGCDDRRVAHLRHGVALRIGFRRPGLRIRPAGGRGTRKLQDLFVDARVPREERDAWPLVFAGDRLAWVPGLAVDADLAAAKGEPSQHVDVIPMPASPTDKVVRLESPPGVLI
ncbi:MAG TPA: tRNA lysidine(34) synthetase TilS, partial [Candidatus Dormibacteraeota bacterium]|nr:tRNA lysidine(34) synthetase TilS [Candidatus Dormibacteraeota bacterium]